MFYFPLINIIFLVLIYRVHKGVFWIVGLLQVFVFIAGVTYIESRFDSVYNHFLYYLALTGFGLILGIAGFFIGISLNHRHLYDDVKSPDNQK